MGQDVIDDPNEGVIDRIYDVAIDPSRLEQLIEIWTQQFDGATNPLSLAHPDLASHVRRAEAILETTQSSRASGQEMPTWWVGTFKNAAFVLNTNCLVVAANRAAQQVLNVAPGAGLDSLPFHAEDIACLRTALSGQSRERGNNATLLLRNRSDDAIFVFHVTPTLNGEKGYCGIATSAHVWPEPLGGLLASAFDLTLAETEVLKDLTFGFSVKEIAARRMRLETTVRTQVRRLLEKTSTRNLIELVRTTMVLMDIAHERDQAGPRRSSSHGVPASLRRHEIARIVSIKVGQGRNLDFLSVGQPDGAAFFMLPTDAGFTRLTASAEDWIADQGLRMVVPIRAGYGNSDLPAAGYNAMELFVEDILAIANHAGIVRCPVLAFADDLHTAVSLAATAPQRFTAIIGVGAVMPASERRHMQRMPTWTRFVIHNARHAPRTMPFVGLAIMGFVKSLGQRQFLESALASSPADVKALQNTELQSALLRNDNVAFQSKHFHKAWAAWAVANYGKDWQDMLVSATVPITLFAGTEDPFSPIETVREFTALTPAIELREYADCGQLLYHLWPEFLAEIRRHLLADPA